MLTKAKLAVVLSKIKPFSTPRIKAEQYMTDSQIASDILWQAFMQGDIGNKRIVDLGCGTGILGIGALLLGAKKVYFVDNDKDALRVCKENIASFDIEDESYEIICSDVSAFKKKVDLVLQNPPFGTRQVHADRRFLEVAFRVASNVYSFHKTSTDAFVRVFSTDNDFAVREVFNFAFPIKKTQVQHKRKIMRIEVSCYHLVKG